MNKLAKLAQLHGFKSALFSTFVLVWDNDGSIAATNADSLKE